MKEIGVIVGEIVNSKVTFEKSMPKNSIVNTKGERRLLDKKHPKIYYSGTLSENKTEIIGTWKFKKKLGFLLGTIPIIYRPANGSWKMNLKIILLLISLNFFISCDCIQNVAGIILDAETKINIGYFDVWLYIKDDENKPEGYEPKIVTPSFIKKIN
jgi:hypothetical protein